MCYFHHGGQSGKHCRIADKVKEGRKVFFLLLLFFILLIFLFKSTLFILSEREKKSQHCGAAERKRPRSPGTPDVASEDQKIPIVFLRLMNLHLLLTARRAACLRSDTCVDTRGDGSCRPISPVSVAAKDWIGLSVFEQRVSGDRRRGKGIKDSRPIAASHRCQMAPIRVLIRM